MKVRLISKKLRMDLSFNPLNNNLLKFVKKKKLIGWNNRINKFEFEFKINNKNVKCLRLMPFLSDYRESLKYELSIYLITNR